MKYHTLFFLKINLREMLQNLSFAAVVIGALRAKDNITHGMAHSK